MRNLGQLQCNIQEIRKRKSITQEQISEITGITVVQLSRYENEKVHPSLINLWLIAEALGCEVGELYSRV